MVRKPFPGAPDSYPVSQHVDGDNVRKIAHSDRPGYSDINRGHTDWKDSKTGATTDPPEYASDRD